MAYSSEPEVEFTLPLQSARGSLGHEYAKSDQSDLCNLVPKCVCCCGPGPFHRTAIGYSVKTGRSTSFGRTVLLPLCRPCYGHVGRVQGALTTLAVLATLLGLAMLFCLVKALDPSFSVTQGTSVGPEGQTSPAAWFGFAVCLGLLIPLGALGVMADEALPRLMMIRFPEGCSRRRQPVKMSFGLETYETVTLSFANETFRKLFREAVSKGIPRTALTEADKRAVRYKKGGASQKQRRPPPNVP